MILIVHENLSDTVWLQIAAVCDVKKTIRENEVVCPGALFIVQDFSLLPSIMCLYTEM